MTSTLQDLDGRIGRFREDLASDVDLTTVIRKHITTGEPAGIEGAAYFELRQQVADAFKIHPNSVVAVGSSRTGFSLKNKGDPKARYRPFGSGSDIDVAVVSPSLFQSYWDAVFGLVRVNQSWTLDNGKTFARDLFCGWVTPQHLPTLPRFENARFWTELFDGITRSRICGIRPVKARLYRDWTRLEAYQERLVAICRSEERTARMKGTKA